MQFYENFLSKKAQDIRPEQVINLMQTDEDLAKKTKLHQELLAQGQETAANAVKESTPQVAVGFLMEGGKGVECCRGSNNQVLVDFDAKKPEEALPPEELERVKTILRTSRHALIGGESISGMGYHIIVPYTLPEGIGYDMENNLKHGQELYRRVCRCINNRYAAWCGHPMDDKCTNVNRMMALAHDPLAVYRPDAEPFCLTREELGINDEGGFVKMKTPKRAYDKNGNLQGVPIGDHLERVVKALEERGEHFVKGNRHNFVMLVSFMLNREGVNENEAAQALDDAYLGQMDGCPSAVVHSCYKSAADEFGVWLPRGKTSMSNEEKLAKQAEFIATLKAEVVESRQFRYNTLGHRIEVSQDECHWKVWDDRAFDTVITAMREKGYRLSDNILRSLINSSDVSPDYNPLFSWLEGLPEWHEGDCNYVSELLDHFEFEDTEYTDFYLDKMRKWLRGTLALWLGISDNNAQILMFVGKEHIGKSHMAKQILPPHLRDFQAPANPYKSLGSTDSEISASEKLILILDELDIYSNAKSNQLKFEATQNSSYARSAYDRYRVQRRNIASRIGTTNHKQFIREAEGDRRFLTVLLKGTKNTTEFPINYEGLYSQLLYELKHNMSYEMTYEDSMEIKEHNRNFQMLDNTLEAVKAVVRKPKEGESALAMTPTEIQQLLMYRNYRGSDFHVNRIGKALTDLELEKKHTKRGTAYLVCKIDPKEVEKAQVDDAQEAGNVQTDDAKEIKEGELPF